MKKEIDKKGHYATFINNAIHAADVVKVINISSTVWRVK